MAREVHGALLKGRENAKRLSVDAFEACFKEWSGNAPFTAWPDRASTETASGVGQTVDLSFADVVKTFEEHANGPPLPKGEGHVIAFGTSHTGGAADADCDQITWLFLDDDDAGPLTKLLDFLDLCGVAYIAQRRGVKWHLHLPLATPITVPQPYIPAWKKEHVARMEWITGVFSELAELKLDLHSKKKVYGFDAAIASLRLLGLCYPYARRKEEDEVPETRWNAGRALDVDAMLALTNFEWSSKSGKHRVLSKDEADGRRKAMDKAKLVRHVMNDGKLALICPWSVDITPNGHDAVDMTSTVLFPNGVWHCSHETCAGRGWKDVDEWLADHNPEAREEAWSSQLTYSEKGGVKNSIHNVLLILEHDPAWKGLLKYDERACRVVIAKDPPWEGDRVYGDAFIARAAAWLAKTWNIEAYDLVAKGIETVARSSCFDPVTDYLNKLKWDGVARLDSWLVKYLKADDNKFNREIGKMWLISAVKRGTIPGCQADHMLVLEGKQKIGKTSAFRILGGEWYSDVTTIHGAAAMERLQNFWIMEMSELSAIARSDMENFKAFVTRREDSYRAAYARVVEHRARRCVFGGTTNEGEYLEDTQNRRIWPVLVRQLDFAGLERDRDQLFAEAMVCAQAGDVWHIVDSGVQELAEAAQAARRYANPWEDKIAAFLENLTVSTTHKVMQTALGLETKDQSKHYKSVGRILRGLGWGPKTIQRPGSGSQIRVLVKDGTDTADIRWEDLGGPSLALIKGGKV